MKAHVFYYQWPGIKEGLTHKEVETTLWPEAIPAPQGALIATKGHWFLRGKNKVTGKSQTMAIAPELVPAIFRTHLLLVT